MQASSQETWLVGAGGLGRVFAAHLCGEARNGPVRLVPQRTETAAGLRDGIRVRLPHGSVIARPRISPLSDLRPGRPPAAVIVCVKSYDTDSVARKLQPLIDEQTVVITPQNGLNGDRLGAILSHGRLVAAVLAFDGAADGRAGAVQRRTDRQIRVGGLAGTAGDVVEHASRVLSPAAPVTVAGDINGALWGKLVVNAAGNAVSAIYNQTMHEVTHTPASLRQCVSLVREGLAVARALGVHVTAGDLAGMEPSLFESGHPDWTAMERAYGAAHSEFGELRSSMCRDVLAGRPTEAEWLNGELCRQGAISATPTPEHARVLQRLRALAPHAGSGPEMLTSAAAPQELGHVH